MINVFLILVVFSYIQFHFQTEATDDKFAACQKTYQCGNVYITYPFYDGYSRPAYCGFPGFKLNCSDAGPEFTISDSQTYYLLSMDSNSHTVSVARDDLWTNLCPETLFNTSINSRLFNYTNADENVTLYYECSREPSYKENTLFCPNFYTNHPYGFFTTTESKDMLMKFPSDECKGSVIVPIYQSASTSVTNPVSLLRAIHEGFELEWFADNDLCDECRKSGGECGYNMEQNEFACYCSNGSFGVKCNGIVSF